MHTNVILINKKMHTRTI